MKMHIRLLVITGAVCAVLAPFVFFFNRTPVLVVTEAPFAALYGASRLRRQQVLASLTLFRQVKPVMIADSASPDMVALAVTEASPQPFCVLFSRSQARAALYFHEQHPETPAALLSGLVSVPEIQSTDSFLCMYGTDREIDLYRAGICAGILGRAKQITAPQTAEQDEPAALTYIFWQDRFMQAAGRDIFTRGVREEDTEAVIVFVRNAAEIPEATNIACAVLAGAASEFLEKNLRVPQILFSWMDPALTTMEVAVQFDDSVWALAVPAVRMAVRKQAEGHIPSQPLTFSKKVADNNVSRALKKSVKKIP